MAKAKLLGKTAAAAALALGTAWRALFSFGIPSNARLRLILLSPSVRRRRAETRAQLMSRLRSVETSFGLDRIAFEVVDLAMRGARLTLLPQPEMPALQCMLKVDCYFIASVSPADLIPRVIDREGLLDGPPSLFDRSLTLGEITNRTVVQSAYDDPTHFRAGPLTLRAVNDGISESIDWDVPEGRQIADPPAHARGFRPTVLRDRSSWTPSPVELQEYRNGDGTLVHWSLRSWYFIRPK
jgi:hypothetical protein